MDYDNILSAALDTAADAAFAAIDLYGEADCGNALVVFTGRKGRKAVIEACKRANIWTSKHHSGGIAIHILAGMHRITQTRAVFEKGCDAFVGTFLAAGIECHTHSYAD